MPRNVLTLPVHVKPLQGRSFVQRIAHLPNLPKAENVSADIPDVDTEVSGTDVQKTKIISLEFIGKFKYEGGEYVYPQTREEMVSEVKNYHDICCSNGSSGICCW